jgi:subtilisin-like proprotein convertase family protein
MRKLRILGLGLSLMAWGAQSALAQITVPITDGGSVTLDCGAGGTLEHTFVDDNANGNYPSNADFTVTVCPDGVNGSKVSLRMFTDVGDTWDVHSSDTLFVYDGTSTSAPLLGAFNSATDPVGIGPQASFDNPSGCLTFRFVSSAATEGAGFEGIISCGFPCQPFTPTITSVPAQVPADTGWIDICLGDTVWLQGGGIFPYSGTKGGLGYDQSSANSTYNWEFADGTTFTNQQSVFFVPQVRAGYFVEMRMTDVQGCVAATTTKIRVSTIPDFSQTTNQLQDTICLGESTILVGGVSFTDTTGVLPTEGSFINGGIFAGLTYLPDGSGVNYQTTIDISNFEEGQVVQNGTDIMDMCVTMEHSYLGDLEMRLTCPNGTSINIFNSFTGAGLFPGGFGGGGTYLGQALDNGNGTPGVGWEYCFSDLATWGTMGQEFQQGNTTPTGGATPGNAMTEGTYMPEQSYDAFIGCPINGTWTLTVRDNIGVDDGYIFEWGILFNPDIDPNAEFYVPTIAGASWDIDPTIIANQGDTLIVVQPSVPGSYDYTFRVTDSFGCDYDTTLTVHVVPPLAPMEDVFTCGLSYQLIAAEYDIIGQWTYIPPAVGATASFSPNAFSRTPVVTVSQQGAYQFIYTSSYCNQTDTVEVLFAQAPVQVALTTDTVCPGSNVIFNALNTGINASYVWTPGGETTQLFTLENVTQTTGVQVVVTNDCGSVTSAATVRVVDINVGGPLEVCLQNDGDLFVTGSREGGEWSFTGPAGGNANFAPNAQSQTPSVTSTVAGSYTLTYTDNECGTAHTWPLTFAPAPTVQLTADTNRICVEDEIVLRYTTNTAFLDAITWSPYSSSTDSLVLSGGDSLAFSALDSLFTVTVTVENFCGEGEATFTYQVINCNINLPNVFNPNSSVAVNSFFNVEALDLHPGNNMKIYDRWGRLRIDQDDYHLSPWNGDGAADGVYFYVLTRNGYDPITGYVHKVSSSN